MFNNQFWIRAIEDRESGNKSYERTRKAQARLPTDPVLGPRFPPQSVLDRDAASELPRAALRQIRLQALEEAQWPQDVSSSPTTPSSPEIEDKELSREASNRWSSISTAIGALTKARPANPFKDTTPGERRVWKEPQPFEILRAIERKDLMFLMEVRDRAFHTLLRKTGDVTPLLYAMRIGPSHREVAIILVGALSRWVNHLEPEDMEQPKTKVLLKALRTNLKLAIDYGLQSHQPDLIASFLQTLIMSEGEKWVHKTVEGLTLALRSTPEEGRPVETAEEAIRAFATRELGKKENVIAAMEDYIANATVDLLMMAAWSLASEVVGGEAIPYYCFARDDRIYLQFAERLQELQGAIRRKCNKRLRWQLKVLQEGVRGRHITYRKKVELLKGELDIGNGP